MWHCACRWLGAAVLVAALIAAVSTISRADNYPSKTITIIAPASPGGVTPLMVSHFLRLHP